ncbi:hypothetical protein F4860DRAFT_5012 [Xylaria cubensis]|nr:hypothetical protein F4860DRAFT_5012 [Xylaria cubensis]
MSSGLIYVCSHASSRSYVVYSKAESILALQRKRQLLCYDNFTECIGTIDTKQHIMYRSFCCLPSLINCSYLALRLHHYVRDTEMMSSNRSQTRTTTPLTIGARLYVTYGTKPSSGLVCFFCFFSLFLASSLGIYHSLTTCNLQRHSHKLPPGGGLDECVFG